MANLTKASWELFGRSPDEAFASLPELLRHCVNRKGQSQDRWLPPNALRAVPLGHALVLCSDDTTPLEMNDWSFTQLCGLAGVAKDTVNRLTADTASKVFSETIPKATKPVQLFSEGDRLRSLHGTSYTRLFNSEVVAMLSEFATDFGPPPIGVNGMTGLYAGEQDMFCFLIDPTGWIDIGRESFAPGIFAWNSEVGKRSVGVSTFWFQAVCRNHIVWDAVDVVEVTRNHTGKVGGALAEIRTAVERLVEKRDERKDGFAATIRKAMETKLGEDAEEVLKVLSENGVGKTLGKKAIEIARTQGRFTVFSLVDALTRLAGEATNAGDRLIADQRAAGLFKLVAA